MDSCDFIFVSSIFESREQRMDNMRNSSVTNQIVKLKVCNNICFLCHWTGLMGALNQLSNLNICSCFQLFFSSLIVFFFIPFGSRKGDKWRTCTIISNYYSLYFHRFYTHTHTHTYRQPLCALYLMGKKNFFFVCCSFVHAFALLLLTLIVWFIVGK